MDSYKIESCCLITPLPCSRLVMSDSIYRALDSTKLFPILKQLANADIVGRQREIVKDAKILMSENV